MAPSASRVSIRKAVWIVRCSEPLCSGPSGAERGHHKSHLAHISPPLPERTASPLAEGKGLLEESLEPKWPRE
eukprot:8036078-Heterocapsa_arctica.AAC.1